MARNALSNYALRGLVGLSALALTPYLFRKLGEGGFGTWSVIFTITTVFTVVTFGFVSAGGKLVSELRGTGRRDRLERIVGTSAGMMALAGLGALAISAVLAFSVSGLAAPGAEGDFRAGLILLGASMLIYFPATAWGATLVGYGRYDRYNVGEAVAVVVFSVGTVAALEAGGGVLSVAAAQAAGYAAGGLTTLALLHRTDPDLRLRPSSGDAETRRAVLGFGSLTVLAEGMLFVSVRMDTVVIAALRGAAAAAPFAAALKLQSGLQALTLPFLLLVLPTTAELWAQGRHDEVRARLVQATRASLQITLPVAVALALFAPDLVGVWLGEDAPAVTAGIVAVLMAVQTVTLSAVAAEKVMIGIGRARPIAVLAVIEGIANIAVSIALVAAFGAIGAAFGTLFTTAVLAPVRFPLVARAIQMPLARLVGRGLGVAALSSAPALIAMVGVWAMMDEGALRLAVGLGVGVGVAAAIGLHQIGGERLRGLWLDARGGRSGEAPLEDPELPATAT